MYNEAKKIKEDVNKLFSVMNENVNTFGYVKQDFENVSSQWANEFVSGLERCFLSIWYISFWIYLELKQKKTKSCYRPRLL
jgi:hypothetical protein